MIILGKDLKLEAIGLKKDIGLNLYRFKK